MKISATGIYSNQLKLNSCKSVRYDSYTDKARLENNRCSNPTAVHAFYPVTFGANGGALGFLKEAVGLHCPYCGIKMIQPSDYSNIDFSWLVPAKAAMETVKELKDKLVNTDRMKFVLERLNAAVRTSSDEAFEGLSECFGFNKYAKIFNGVKRKKLAPNEFQELLVKKLQQHENRMHPVKKELFRDLKTILTYRKIQAAIKISPDMAFKTVLSMLKAEDCSPVLKQLSNERLIPGDYTRKIVNQLLPFEECMQPKQREVFNAIKLKHVQFPHLSLEDLFLKMRPEALAKLHVAEIVVLDKISEAAQKLSPNVREELSKLIDETKALLRSDANEQFKRKKFVNKVVTLLYGMASKAEFPTVSNIHDIACSMPTSQKNASAFIVKYSGAAYPMVEGNFQFTVKPTKRSAREIAQSLLYPSVMTLEHVIPQHRLRVSPSLTPERSGNYLPTCAPCNNNEKSGDPLSDLLKRKPEVKGHILRFFEEAVEAVNSKKIRDIDYLPDVSNIVIKESGGQITKQEVDSILAKLDFHNVSIDLALEKLGIRTKLEDRRKFGT